MPAVVRLALLVVALGPAALAQPARTVPVGDPAYVAVERLQRRGLLLELHPTVQPYTEAEVSAALGRIGRPLDRREAEWVRLLRQRGPVAVPGTGDVAVRADLGAAPQYTTSTRLDPLRPTDGERAFPVGDGALVTEADLHFTMGTGGLVAQAGARHSAYLQYDPDGYDDPFYKEVRSEEAYVAYRAPLGAVALGRIGTHWGPAGGDALMIGANPRPYDALHLRVGGSRLALRGLIGQLDSALPDGTFSGRRDFRPGDRPSAEPRIDRFVAAHRLDWRPVPNLALTLMESAVYSGSNADLSLAYALPSQTFSIFVDNTPKNVENNGAVGAMLWAHWRDWTVQGEVFVDDVDIRTGREPISAALAGEVTRADVVPAVDAAFSLTAVTARAYLANQPEGVYQYARRGLAQEFNDFVRLDLRAEWFAAPGVSLAPAVSALWQGGLTQETTPFPPNDLPAILTGEVSRTVRFALDARYQRAGWWWARADVGLNVSDDAVAEGVHALVTVGARLGAATAFRAEL